MKFKNQVWIGSITVASALLAGCASDSTSGNGSTTTTMGAKLNVCETLVSQFNFANAVVSSGAMQAAGALTVAGQPIAQHCLVKGTTHNRSSADGKTWAIGYEMRLPVDWNGRFYYQANGGLDGSVVTALGGLGGGPVTNALNKGFAVISSDAGHTGAQTTQFGFDAQARLDYGYQAVGKLTPMAKDLIRVAYGKAPSYSYIGGCSNGGRHTMVAASRFTEQYDGYLAGAPGFNLPKAAAAQIWGSQQYATQMTAGATVVNGTSTIPDLSTAFTNAERTLVSKAVLNKCDALDGLADGVVNDTLQCQTGFDLARDVPTCSANRDGTCLTTAQKTMVANVYAGGQTSNGQAFYSKFWFDPGIASPNWALWRFVNAQALDPLASGTIFRVPPAFIQNSLTVSIDDLVNGYSATNSTYTESGLSFMTPPDPDNISTKLRARNARMMVYHGASDPVFSAADTARWVDAMQAKDAQRADAVRYFVVPGMPHCSGGAATDQFDMLDSLVAWVENGKAPESVVAKARGTGNVGGVNADIPSDWSASRTRLLCPYPKVARFTSGATDKESAASFTCQS